MMHKQGENRNQMFMFSLEGSIPLDSFVRVVDAFVDAIDLKSFGFAHVQCKEEGRPPYHPAVLLKLYLYGYRYGIRTTRKLEREAKTNLEAMWLLSGLRPKYKTIADFRKNHSKAFREVFRRFVCLLKEWKLIEGKTIAIDSFKVRAVNSLRNNFNQAKLQRHLDYIENQLIEYESQLDANDKEEDKKELEAKIAERKEKQTKYKELQDKLANSTEEQISLTDPDSRSVILHRNIVHVGYNIQAASDEKHKLFVEYDTGDVNDTHALAPVAIKTKELLKVDQMDVLADKGYHTGVQLERCKNNNIRTFVSPKAPSTKNVGLYPVTDFVYDKEEDKYICPQGHHMHTNGNWNHHSDGRKDAKGAFRFKRYHTPACKICKSRHLCTRNKTKKRYIDRSEYADTIDENAKRIGQQPDYYKLRKQITEHPFGTLKRQRGFTHALVSTKGKVMGEIGLAFIGYNLTRCITILGAEKLIKLLREYSLLYLLHRKRLILSLFKRSLFPEIRLAG